MCVGWTCECNCLFVCECMVKYSTIYLLVKGSCLAAVGCALWFVRVNAMCRLMGGVGIHAIPVCYAYLHFCVSLDGTYVRVYVYIMYRCV